VPGVRARRCVGKGSSVITDGHDGYRGLVLAGYRWTRVPHPRAWHGRGGGNRATPGANGTTSRLKRWLTGTYNRPPADLDLNDDQADLWLARHFGVSQQALMIRLATLRLYVDGAADM
jgi:hypothetical protein